jgi:hypothetical protein
MRHVEENNLLIAYEFGFRAGNSTMFQCMRVMDCVTLHFSNNMSTAAVSWIWKKPLTLHGMLA